MGVPHLLVAGRLLCLAKAPLYLALQSAAVVTARSRKGAGCPGNDRLRAQTPGAGRLTIRSFSSNQAGHSGCSIHPGGAPLGSDPSGYARIDC